MPKDFLGKELKLNDEVVFMRVGYRELLKGIIIKMSEKSCLVSHKETATCQKETKQFYDQLIFSQREEEEDLDFPWCDCLICLKHREGK